MAASMGVEYDLQAEESCWKSMGNVGLLFSDYSADVMIVTPESRDCSQVTNHL